jgi:hypothetical protein
MRIEESSSAPEEAARVDPAPVRQCASRCAVGWVHDDGGRAAAGYKGHTSDCVTRAVAIATGRPYQEVYDALNQWAKIERPSKRHKRSSNARTGINRQTRDRYLESLGWEWTPTMGIGTGCRVHLRADELPSGRLIAKCSRHLVALIDGVVHDTSDPSRGGTRCVYGYWQPVTDRRTGQGHQASGAGVLRGARDDEGDGS